MEVRIFVWIRVAFFLKKNPSLRGIIQSYHHSIGFYFLCTHILGLHDAELAPVSFPVSSRVLISTLSAACSNTSRGLGPFSPIPSPFHTLPVNHPNFIDVTGITDETLSVSQLSVCASPQRFRLCTDVHVHKYTLAAPYPHSAFLVDYHTLQLTYGKME